MTSLSFHAWPSRSRGAKRRRQPLLPELPTTIALLRQQAGSRHYGKVHESLSMTPFPVSQTPATRDPPQCACAQRERSASHPRFHLVAAAAAALPFLSFPAKAVLSFRFRKRLRSPAFIGCRLNTSSSKSSVGEKRWADRTSSTEVVAFTSGEAGLFCFVVWRASSTSCLLLELH